MKKFLVLYQSQAALSGMSVAQMMTQATPEQVQAGMALWEAWHQKCGSAIVNFGSPLDHSTTVTAGSSAESKSPVTGFAMLEAGSMQEAVALLNDHPHFHAPGASIQVFECVPMPGM